MTTTTNFVWDSVSDCLLTELDGTNAVQAVYTNEPQQYGAVLSQRRGATTSTLHADALGTTRALTDSTQTTTDTYLFDGWGNVITSSGTTVNPLRWVGRYAYYHDASAGLIYVRARVYQPTVARWMSMDPLQRFPHAGGYIYCVNVAVALLDPSGLISTFADAQELGCADLHPDEFKALKSCNNKQACNCGPHPELRPFTIGGNYAAVLCRGGEPTASVNLGYYYNAEGENPRPPIDHQIYIEELKKNGILDCIFGHEMHHVAQYKCLCPAVCRGVPDGVGLPVSSGCFDLTECWAWAGQLNCMIKKACAAFNNSQGNGQKKDEEKERLDYIMKSISNLSVPIARDHCTKAGLGEREDLVKNKKNFERLLLGQPCIPKSGI